MLLMPTANSPVQRLEKAVTSHFIRRQRAKQVMMSGIMIIPIIPLMNEALSIGCGSLRRPMKRLTTMPT